MDKLSEIDRDRIFSWNKNPPKFIGLCAHDVFTRIAKEQPHAPAVEAWDGKWTYGELEHYSSALACVLRKSGVRTGEFVALCFRKSKWTAVAVFGVLKAGGAFVFLDHQHPIDRLRQICENVKGRFLLTSTFQLELANAVGPSLITHVVDEDLLTTSIKLGANFNVSVQPHHPAYAVFTSGSTGTPKGALISHDAIVSGTLLQQGACCLDRQSRVLNFAAFAFDANIYEHFWALLIGGCLCIPSEEDRLGDLEGAIQRLEANWSLLVPSFARCLDPKRLPSLKFLFLGGEALAQKDIDTWSPYLQLVNVYGPAECAIVATIQPLGPSTPPCTIGYAHAVLCWVVDEHDPQVLVSVGRPGELILEGPAISQGYINNPEQTAKAFITNPAWLPVERHSNRKLYKTGDIVRQNSDGSLYYLGRKDTQVKFNGRRIELSEIEHHARTALSNSAQEVIVEMGVLSPGSSTQALLAFILIANSQSTQSAELIKTPDEAFLKQVTDIKGLLLSKLPKYMVPEVYFPISFLPRTTSGKIDRKRLREEACVLPGDQLRTYMSSARRMNTDHELPLTDEERVLQRMWSFVLNLPLDHISRHDNWVHLGGDSLLAMKMVEIARKEGYKFSVVNVMKERTIAALARVTRSNYCREVDRCTGTLPKMPFALLNVGPDHISGIRQIVADQCQMSPEDIEDIYPCTREHYWMIPRAPGDIDYTLRVQAEIPERLDRDRLVEAWSATVKANPMLRSRVVELPDGQFFYAVFPDVVPLDFNPAENVDQYRHGRKLWKLASPLLCIGVEEDRLVMLIHHLIYDAYSVPLIFRNMERAYQGHSLPVTPYRPFRQALSESQDMKQQYWDQRFKGWTGSPWPSVKKDAGTPLETRKLHRQMPLHASDFTHSTTLHLTMAVTISWYLQVSDIVFGTVTSRRGAPVPGVQDIIAPMSALLPTRVRLGPLATIHENLQVLQEDSLDAMANELVDSRIFENVSGELATALRYQTLFTVEADVLADKFTLFRNISMEYDDGPTFMWNLGIHCSLSPDLVKMSVHISEPTISEEIDWDRFADRFCVAFDWIQRRPDIKLGQIFDKMATVSFCRDN
ncbi:hypothetical protein N7527_009145 [Penicillium freii]|uniref:Carrier domain-containing protein n=1 Tax=Penicillium freii TaxID=48697 RepID=A0A117NMK0_PENFR|nr:hypothetical protein N7527_009145 [Penicillium freii]KUM59362.1 hypothetical protein ACN42_g7775 [Penicillium freii]